METAALITAFTTLFVIIDPIGLTPIYIALTNGMSPKHRRGIAIRACLVGAALLIVFGIFGEAILNFVGISMPAFRIAGGILLFITALEMLFQRRQKRRESNAEEAHEDFDDPSVFPLGIPLIAGPGSLTTMILLTDGAKTSSMLWAIFAVMIMIVLIVFIFFQLAPSIEKLLGKTGIIVVTRLLGMLLAALAVQFVITGLIEAFSGPMNMVAH